MYAKYSMNDSKAPQLIKAFTVENKNLEREERIAWRELPRKRFIKLYRKKANDYYFPIWCFTKWIVSDRKLSEPLNYIDTWAEWDHIEEQWMIMESIKEWHRSWLIEMKTGRWKGNLIVKLIDYFQEKTLICVHNKKTLTELLDKFKKFSNYEPWLYYSWKKQIRDITITTHASFVLKNEEFRDKFWLVIVDEADHWLSEKMIDAITFCWADWLFWLTWTPYRQELSTSDMTLIFWKHFKVINQANNWYNILPEIVRILCKNTTVYSFDSFNDVKQQLMDDQDRLNKQIEFIKWSHENSKIWLILVDRIAECHMYYNRLKEEGIPCCIINWETKTQEDEVNIQDMIDRRWIIIGTSAKVWRWVDIPQIDSIYLFYPCRFEWNVVQAVWRWLRKYEWKDKVVLYDWCDIPILKWQASTRYTTYRKEYVWTKIGEVLIW